MSDLNVAADWGQRGDARWDKRAFQPLIGNSLMSLRDVIDV